MAIAPKTKGDEDKIGNGISRILEEDPTFKMVLNTETKQTIIYGVGDQHLDILTSKLKANLRLMLICLIRLFLTVKQLRRR